MAPIVHKLDVNNVAGEKQNTLSFMYSKIIRFNTVCMPKGFLFKYVVPYGIKKKSNVLYIILADNLTKNQNVNPKMLVAKFLLTI